MSIASSRLFGWQAEKIFFTAMAISMTVVVFIGFSRSFFLDAFFPEVTGAPESVFFVHGVLFTAWMALLIVQTWLVGSRRVALHRKLGLWGVGLAAAMVGAGTAGSFVAAARPGGFLGVGMPPLEFLAIVVADMVLFGLFVGLAALWRRDGPRHKRLMLLATINLLEAAIVRIPLPFIAAGGPLMHHWMADIFIVALVVWDITTLRRLHSVTLWGGLLTVVSQPLRFWIAGTAAWLTIAAWAVSLVR
jgi:uncharacterized membrane protein YozB (DUF420 family)